VTLQRLILTFRNEELVLHALYRTKDAPNLREFQRSLDASMGGYFGFRNGMGAEPH
jgi:hypothetical protein